MEFNEWILLTDGKKYYLQEKIIIYSTDRFKRIKYWMDETCKSVPNDIVINCDYIIKGD